MSQLRHCDYCLKVIFTGQDYFVMNLSQRRNQKHEIGSVKNTVQEYCIDCIEAYVFASDLLSKHTTTFGKIGDN
jgi:hypothetical protein